MRTLVLASFGIALLACTPGEKSAVRTATDVATTDCTILQSAGDPTVNKICATEEEIAPLIKHLFAARAYRATHPGTASSSAMDACTVPLGGTP